MIDIVKSTLTIIPIKRKKGETDRRIAAFNTSIVGKQYIKPLIGEGQ